MSVTERPVSNFWKFKHDDGSDVQDLYILIEVLSILGDGWHELESSYNITRRAMLRLRRAYSAGELNQCCASLARYFDETPANGL